MKSKITRQRNQQLHLESLELRMLLTGFTAYNGLFPSDQTSSNTTFYSPISGQDSAGPLKDVTTGEDQAVILSVVESGVNFGGNGSQPAANTDAADIFSGFVDFSAGGQRSLEIGANAAYEYRFENLDAGATYQFAGTAIRGNNGYTDRWTLVEIVGADSFVPSHSSAIGVITNGLAANQVAFWAGNNAAADQGYVAQWLDVNPGADGEFQVVSTQYRGAVPTSIDSGGVADGSKGYGLAGIRLIEDVAAGPPVVENTAASNVFAFEAQVAGQITTTGGEVPRVTVFYGTNDGGSNAAAWQNSVDVGFASRDFSATLDGLTPNTKYFYRSFATNSLGDAWATESVSFTTLPAAPPTVVNAAP